MQAPRASDVQAIGQKGDEDVRLDASLELVKDRPDREVALEVLERLLDCMFEGQHAKVFGHDLGTLAYFCRAVVTGERLLLTREVLP